MFHYLLEFSFVFLNLSKLTFQYLKILKIEDLEIEVEYQADTIGKFGLDFDGRNFLLTNKQTDCLAKDKCGIPIEKTKVKLSTLNEEPCCSPDGNCC